MEEITSEEIELFHSMHELILLLSMKLDKIERELMNLQAANVSQVIVIDKAIANIGTVIKQMRILK